MDDYIALYKRIFVFENDNSPKYLELYRKIFQYEKPPDIQPVKDARSLIPIDLNKLPFLHVKIFDSDGVKANGINLGGDEHSYVDFKRHRDTGIISFYRRNPHNNRNVLIEYNPTTKELSANGQKIGAIHPQLQQVLDQLNSMSGTYGS